MRLARSLDPYPTLALGAIERLMPQVCYCRLDGFHHQVPMHFVAGRVLLYRLACLIGGPEYIYQGKRDREHDGTKHDSQNAKDLQAPEHGKED